MDVYSRKSGAGSHVPGNIRWWPKKLNKLLLILLLLLFARL